MNTDIPQAGPELIQAISQVQDPDTLLQKIQDFLNTLESPYSEINQLIMALDGSCSPEQMPVIRLLEAELLLFFSAGPIDAERVENIFKQLSSFSITSSVSSGSITPVTKIKYNDLYMDYQFLLAPKVKQMRLVDVVTKKINLLSQVSLEICHNVVAHIRHKILVYYLLCDSDYRTKSVLKYLDEERVLASVSSEIATFLRRRDKLTSVEEFRCLVHHLKLAFYPFNVLEKTHGKQLLENHVDNNLSKIPRYYTSIRLSRIQHLLLAPDVHVDIEDVLYKMIAGQKFPYGATIDQISGYVYFSEKPPKYNDFDTHVKKVCDTVDVISAGILARQLQGKQ